MSLSALFSKIPLSLTDRLGCCALHFLWQGAAIAAVLWLLLAFCRRGTAELRHALCGLALLAMAAAPVITWQGLPEPEPLAVKVLPLPEAVVVKDFPESADLSRFQEAEPELSAASLPFAPPEAWRPSFAEDEMAGAGTETPLANKAEAPSAAPWWQRGLGLLWLAGAALMGVWRICGLWGTFRIIRRAERAAGEILERVQRLARPCGLRRMPDVRITGRLISPAVAGVLRPVLLLPAAAMAGLSPRELDFVLAHEFAHIRRQDFLLGLLQSLAEMLLFFHPVVWWVSHRMSLEREQACDDAAMRVTGNRQAGARALARLAELQLQHTTALAPAAGGGQILTRVRRILDPARPPEAARRGQVLILLPALLTAAAVPLLLMTQRAESQTAAPPAPQPDTEVSVPAPTSISADAAPVSAVPPLSSPDKSEGSPGAPLAPPPSPDTLPAEAPASAPGAEISPAAASGADTSQASEAKSVPALRGSITDRNGVVLAESVLRNAGSSDTTGFGEIRRYPLGATASHLIGYVKRTPNETPESRPAASPRDSGERKLREQRAVMRTMLEALSKLSGDQLIEAAFSYGLDDETLMFFCAAWKKDRVQLEMHRLMGFGAGHPQMKGLASSIEKQRSILLAASENLKQTLARNIQTIGSSLDTVQPRGTSVGPDGPLTTQALYARVMKVQNALSADLDSNRAALSNLNDWSGMPLSEELLTRLPLDANGKGLADDWRKARREQAAKSKAGFASGHPDMKSAADSVSTAGTLLLQWIAQRKAALTGEIRVQQESLNYLKEGNQRLKKNLLRINSSLEGAAGLERAQEGILSSSFTASADGKSQPAVALTLDAQIQRISENALREAHIGRGAAVVLDVSNGDILAMASVPDFDPNAMVPFISKETWKDLTDDPTVPLVSRALNAYPPGSTFKLVTAIAAGAEGQWNKTWNCSGSVDYGGRPFNCWTVKQAVSPHGTLDLADALKNSCNCWFYQCGNATGIDRIEQTARAFGFGEKAEIGVDYLVADFMPGREWWARQNKGSWTESKTANVAIGQAEVLATPLQMARVAAAVANDGKVWKERLIRQSLIGGLWQAPAPELEHDLAAEGTDPAALAAIRDGMWKTVNEDAGATGKAARSSLVTIAGKTGTAQKWREVKKLDNTGRQVGSNYIGDNHTWFIGFAPFDKPRYAFAIVVGNGKSGGTVCAPIAKRIMESVTLMNEGKLKVELAPLPAAKGNFDYVETVEYRKPLLPE